MKKYFLPTLLWILFTGHVTRAQTQYITLIQHQIANDLVYSDSVITAQDSVIVTQREIIDRGIVVVGNKDQMLSDRSEQISILLQHQVKDAETIHILRKEVRKKSRGAFWWKVGAIGLGAALAGKSIGVF